MDCPIYTRISTDTQAEKEFFSCEAQEEKIRTFIRSQNNWKVFRVYLWNGGLTPYGYKVENKKLVINEDEAKIVKKVFENYITSGSVAKVYRELRFRVVFKMAPRVGLEPTA